MARKKSKPKKNRSAKKKSVIREKRQASKKRDSVLITSTPYDDVFHTMMQKGESLRIPFINEMFRLKEPLPMDASIENISNEYFAEEGNGSQRKIISDSVLHAGRKTYHAECESKPGGTVLVRMFEYDVNIAIVESEYQDYHLTVDMPVSGVLFLRSTSATPDQMMVTINTSGGSIEYPVNVFRLKDYSLDDLMQKNLFFLLPFYPFNLEKEFRGFEQGNEQSREKVTSSLSDLLERLKNFYEGGKLTTRDYLLITDALRKVSDNLTQKYKKTRKEIQRIMNGQVLEFKWEKIWNAGEAKGEARGRKAGKAEGKVEELVGMTHDGLVEEAVAAARAEKKYGIEKDRFHEMLESYSPAED